MSDAAPRLAAADLERLLVHADWLRALARRLVGSGAADDVVQETLIAAMHAPPDAERPPRPWLGRVLRNVARMRFRSESRRARREDVAQLAPAAGDAPDDAVLRLQTHRALCDVVLALDEPYRHTLVMHYYDGRSLADIARADRVPEATVRWRHRHALDLIRARLDERAGGDRRTWLAALAPLAAAAPAARLTQGLLVKKTLAAAVAIAVAVALVVTWRVTSRGSQADDAPPTVEAPAPAARLDFGRAA
ncbi:MAG: sigma-70 family RNA polymerase sigma factor, partial [Deltaproteobacteria bacterium]|nr:sigma-70 family RNA polymerase sigma factor [Deltaproteobacteria bacterium]